MKESKEIGGRMSAYKAVVHYHFKKGMEKKGEKFIEDELIKAAERCGCHDIEFCKDKKDACHFVGMGTWDSLQEGEKFHKQWIANEKELMKYCTHRPHRDVFEITFGSEKKHKRKVA
jgi:hypothetical protein